MNNKTILFKVAQHPLIKMMLKESIVAPSVLARLIVEEMIEEASNPNTEIKSKVKQFVQRNLGAGRGKDFFDLKKANKIL